MLHVTVICCDVRGSIGHSAEAVREMMMRSADFQLPQDLLRARTETHGFDMFFAVIRGTRRSVRFLLQHNAEQNQTHITRCATQKSISVGLRVARSFFYLFQWVGVYLFQWVFVYLFQWVFVCLYQWVFVIRVLYFRDWNLYL